MADRVREQLLGYLLGALEDSERKSVEQQLEADPSLRQRLTELSVGLHPLWVLQPDYPPPTSLAEQTCRLVESRANPWSDARADAPLDELPMPASLGGDAMGVLSPGAGAVSRWRVADVAMTAGILLAVALLIFPAIQSSRFNAQVLACQDNLRQLGVALIQYSDRHHGYFPDVPPRGKLAAAGIYAPKLMEGEFLDRIGRVVCPASPLAAEGEFYLPSVPELLAAEEAELDRLRAQMGGSYGYGLGYVKNGRYRGNQNRHRTFFAIMADAPNGNTPGYQSLNHAGQGQNVLFEDGHVIFFTTPHPAGWADDFFVNVSGHVGVGQGRDDAVIGSSGTQPVLFTSPAN